MINETASNMISVRTVPQAPITFYGTAITTCAIIWAWADVYGEDGYEIYSATNGIMAALDKDTTYWIETMLQSNTGYTRNINSYNISGSSHSMNKIVYTLAQVPSVVSGISLTTDTIRLNWTCDGNKYDIERAADLNGTAVNYSIKGSTPGISYTDSSGLFKNTTYWYRIYSYNNQAVKNTIPSVEIPVRTLLDTTKPEKSPSIPDDEGLYSSSSTLTFSWGVGELTDPDSEITGYSLQVGTLTDVTGAAEYDAGSSTSYAVPGRMHGKTYYARVKARNSVGLYSTWSSTSNGITIDLVPPGLPTLISQSHPDPAKQYVDANVICNISSAPYDLSGIKGFYYTFSTYTWIVPGPGNGIYIDNIGNNQMIISSVNVPDGTLFLNMSCQDGAGNVSTAAFHCEMKIKTKIDPFSDNTFYTVDGTEVFIPSGTFDKVVEIVIRTPAESELTLKMYNPRLNEIVYDKRIVYLTPTFAREIKLNPVTKFNQGKEIRIKLNYEKSVVSPFVESDKIKLKIVYFDINNQMWRIVDNAIFDTDNDTVTFRVNHLTVFMIIEYNLGVTPEFSNYPNPFAAGNGNVTRIRYTLPANSEVEIKIYDLIGELTWQKKISAGEDGGQYGPNEVQWDGKNEAGSYVGAGAYICVLKTNGQTMKTKIGVK
jgi:hypothetical protein